MTMKIRIQVTRDFDLEKEQLCEPKQVDLTRIGLQDMASQCDCGRYAFRFTGDRRGPWVTCVCGNRFNSNSNWVGNVVGGNVDV